MCVCVCVFVFDLVVFCFCFFGCCFVFLIFFFFAFLLMCFFFFFVSLKNSTTPTATTHYSLFLQKCPRILYELMIRCWHPYSMDRPTANEALLILTSLRKSAQLMADTAKDARDEMLQKTYCDPYVGCI